jgi:hypothetical protein
MLATTGVEGVYMAIVRSYLFSYNNKLFVLAHITAGYYCCSHCIIRTFGMQGADLDPDLVHQPKFVKIKSRQMVTGQGQGHGVFMDLRLLGLAAPVRSGRGPEHRGENSARAYHRQRFVMGRTWLLWLGG